MSYDKIYGLMKSAVKTLANTEQFFLPSLLLKVKQAAADYPHDQTILAISNVLNKMDDNHKQMITKGEFKGLYQKLYVNNTRFADYFEQELDLQEAPAVKTAAAQVVPAEMSSYKIADPILTSALTRVFDNSAPLKLYQQEAAQKALKVVGSNLEVWNLQAAQLNIATGNQHFIVVQADYETPKGLTSVLVPVELNKDKALDPSLFQGVGAPQMLTHTNLKNYLLTHAGEKLTLRSSDVLDAITTAVVGKKELSTVELAFAKTKAAKGHTEMHFGDQVLGQTMPALPEKDLELPKAGQFKSFAEKFESPLGVATFKFGAEKINLGRDAVVRSLAHIGIKNPQINVAQTTDAAVIYAVSLDGKLAFNVPVKFANNRVLSPNLLICNGSVMAFTKENLQKLYASKEMDHKAAAVASPSYGLKPSELIDNLRAAILEGNHAKAEDALNVLSNSGDQKAYRTAFDLYFNSLSVKTASAPEKTCTMVINSNTSQHPICGHTGLPLHKTYIDKHGKCAPLTRRGQEEATSGNYFNSFKLLG
jgi:hypothetical protein